MVQTTKFSLLPQLTLYLVHITCILLLNTLYANTHSHSYTIDTETKLLHQCPSSRVPRPPLQTSCIRMTTLKPTSPPPLASFKLAVAPK